MVTWGIVAACFVFVQGATSFYLLRFLLGVTEAGFFPGVILFLTYWVPARHLSRARGYFYMGIALAGILGNPLSGGLLELNGVARAARHPVDVPGRGAAGRRGGRLGVLLPDRPARRTPTWLPDGRAAGAGGDHRGRGHRQVGRPRPAEGARPRSANWRVWYFALIYFCLQIAVYGVTFFLPTQVTAITGQKLGFQASLVTAIPWVFGLAAVAYLPGSGRPHPQAPNDRLRAPAGHRASGIIISGALSNYPVLAIGGLCLAAMGFVAMSPIFWTLPTEYMTGYAAAAGIGLINSLGNLGGFLAPILRDYFKAAYGGNAGLYFLAVGAFACAILFALTAFFKKANEVEAGHLDEGSSPPCLRTCRDEPGGSLCRQALIAAGSTGRRGRPSEGAGAARRLRHRGRGTPRPAAGTGRGGRRGDRHRDLRVGLPRLLRRERPPPPGPGDGARDGRPDRRAGLGGDRARARPAGHRQPGDGLQRLRRPAPAASRSGAAARWCSAWRRRSRRRSPTGSPCRPRTSSPCRRRCRRSWGRWWSRWLWVTTPSAAARPPRRTGCWSSAAGRSGRRACSPPGGSGVDNLALSDVSPSRRELCAGLGAQVIDPSAGDLAGAVAAALGGPANLVVDAVGVTRTVADAFAASASGGRIVLVGMGSPRLDLAAYAVSTGGADA